MILFHIDSHFEQNCKFCLLQEKFVKKFKKIMSSTEKLNVGSNFSSQAPEIILKIVVPQVKKYIGMELAHKKINE